MSNVIWFENLKHVSPFLNWLQGLWEFAHVWQPCAMPSELISPNMQLLTATLLELLSVVEQHLSHLQSLEWHFLWSSETLAAAENGNDSDQDDSADNAYSNDSISFLAACNVNCTFKWKVRLRRYQLLWNSQSNFQALERFFLHYACLQSHHEVASDVWKTYLEEELEQVRREEAQLQKNQQQQRKQLAAEWLNWLNSSRCRYITHHHFKDGQV